MQKRNEKREKAQRNLIYAKRYRQRKCRSCGHKSSRIGKCRLCGSDMKT